MVDDGLVLASVGTSSGTGSALSAASIPPCKIANDWAVAHKNELPTTFSEFKKFDRLHRRAIYALSAPEVRARLWREHMQEFLAPEQGLTTSQRDFIRAAMDDVMRIVSSTDTSLARRYAEAKYSKQTLIAGLGEPLAIDVLSILAPNWRERASHLQGGTVAHLPWRNNARAVP